MGKNYLMPFGKGNNEICQRHNNEIVRGCQGLPAYIRQTFNQTYRLVRSRYTIYRKKSWFNLSKILFLIELMGTM
jgi:hypothetical protein